MVLNQDYVSVDRSDLSCSLVQDEGKRGLHLQPSKFL